MRCVAYALCVDIMSPDTAYVGDIDGSVYVVDLTHDTIKATLEVASAVEARSLCGVTVLGDRVLVGYPHTLVIYRHGSLRHIKAVPSPGRMTSVTTDRQHYYLLTHGDTNTVSVVDVDGNLCHTVSIDSDSKIADCTVVNRQLWVGCGNGAIVIMSSRGQK